MTALRVLVADDHEIVRRGLCAILRSHVGWEVCGEAAGREWQSQPTTCFSPHFRLQRFR
jgi:DNA-binding NarL/FixJ family response regulator